MTALPNLIVILGPTASGKSSVGIALAQQWRGEIVSADSRQVYRGLDIGTAKVTPAERNLVTHHLLDVVDLQEVYTVSQFQHDAIQTINTILAHGKLPFLVGGSPHYIQAVVDHLDMPHIPPQPELRTQLASRPLADLVAQLEILDPQSAATIDRKKSSTCNSSTGSMYYFWQTLFATTRDGKPSLSLPLAGYSVATRGPLQTH